MAQAPEAPARSRAQIAQRTLRTPWWQAPRVTAAVLAAWIAHAAVHVFVGHWSYVPRYRYLTPLYSPRVSGVCVPGPVPWAAGSARCLRSSRAHWCRCRSRRASGCPAIATAAPATGCSGGRPPRAVREPHATCTGETRFPLITQNFGKHPVRYRARAKVSWLNARHMQFARITLGTLMLTRLYIMLAASGAFSDPRIFN